MNNFKILDMRINNFIVLALMVLTINVKAQTSKQDSILISSYFEKAMAFEQTDADSALFYANTAGK